MNQMPTTQHNGKSSDQAFKPTFDVSAARKRAKVNENESPIVTVEDFNLWYGKSHALKNINLAFPKNHVTALIGPSGCGKSTLLRSINRMNDLITTVRTEGRVMLGQADIYARDQDVIQLRKHCGMVFQKSNPFPKSIFENVVYACRINGERDKTRLTEICEQSLQRAGLWDEVKDRLHENGNSLSGGQQQRLCIARAIANEPDVLLMDEPCSALDPVSTSRVEDLILDLRENFTVIIVTHNMQQATRVSDYTAFMLLGDVVEFDRTDKLFTNPQQRETEDYITGRFG